MEESISPSAYPMRSIVIYRRFLQKAFNLLFIHNSSDFNFVYCWLLNPIKSYKIFSIFLRLSQSLTSSSRMYVVIFIMFSSSLGRLLQRSIFYIHLCYLLDESLCKAKETHFISKLDQLKMFKIKASMKYECERLEVTRIAPCALKCQISCYVLLLTIDCAALLTLKSKSPGLFAFTNLVLPSSHIRETSDNETYVAEWTLTTENKGVSGRWTDEPVWCSTVGHKALFAGSFFPQLHAVQHGKLEETSLIVRLFSTDEVRKPFIAARVVWFVKLLINCSNFSAYESSQKLIGAKVDRQNQ